YAFEPGSYARSILRTVVWLHRLSNVAVVPIALGSEVRLHTLTIPLKSSGSFGFGLSHLGKPSERWRAVAQEIVALTTVDRVVKTLDLDRLDFIKADIEGWELRLLQGAENTLARFRPRLLLELSGPALARAGDRLEDAFAFSGGARLPRVPFRTRGKPRARLRVRRRRFLAHTGGSTNR